MLSKNTESFVTKKFLHDQATLQRAIQALSNEISPTVFPELVIARSIEKILP